MRFGSDSSPSLARTALLRSAWLGPVAVVIACSSPPEPVYPPRSEIGPPYDQARMCQPPFPSGIGNGYYWMADLDLGRSCVVYLEQDDCVLGIYQECAAPDSTVLRQWQGRAKTANTVRWIELSPAVPSGGNPPARSPTCCEGAVVGEVGGYSTAVLGCLRGRNCTGLPPETPPTEPQDHVGLVLQQVRIGIQPEQRISGTRLPLEAFAPKVTRLITQNAGTELYALVDGPGADAADGLYQIMLTASGSTRVLSTTSSEPLQVAWDDTQVYLSDGDRVHRRSGSSNQSSGPLGGKVLAMAAAASGLLVATEDGTGTMLRRLDPTTLGEVASARRTERVSSMAADADPAPSALAVLSYQDRERLERIGPDLAPMGPVVELRDGAIPRQLTFVTTDTYGFLAPCWKDSNARTCYWEHFFNGEAQGAGVTERTSAPDVADITDFTIDNLHRYVHLSSSTGPVTVVFRQPLRPALDQRIPFTEATSHITSDGTGRYWVLFPGAPALTRIDPIDDH